MPLPYKQVQVSDKGRNGNLMEKLRHPETKKPAEAGFLKQQSVLVAHVLDSITDFFIRTIATSAFRWH